MRAVIFFTLLFCYAYALPNWADWNANSRLDLSLALATENRLEIDTFAANTGDYAVYNGHRYSDKAPGLSLAALPAVWATARVVFPFAQPTLMRLAQSDSFATTLNPDGSGVNEAKLQSFMALAAATLLAVSLPAAALGVVMFDVLADFLDSRLARLGLVLAYGLATPALNYARNFYAHQFVAALLFFAYALLRRERALGSARATRLIGVGLLLGWSLISEYPTALIVAGLMVYAWPIARRRIVLVLGGMVAPLAIGAAYHLAIFGTPLPVAYRYSELWQAMHQIGFLSLTFPTPEAAFGITLSPYRGLFFIAPFLAFAVFGWLAMARATRNADLWLSLWCAASFLIFNASSAMWDGGFSVGPRYVGPMLPFMMIPIAVAVNSLMAQRQRPLARAALVVFVALVGLSAANVWAQSFAADNPGYARNPLFERALPALASGNVARNFGMALGLRGLGSLAPVVIAPMVALLGAFAWARLRTRPRAEAAASPSVEHTHV